MSDLTQEQYEQLPDFVKSDYTEVDGVYKHAGMMKVKGTLNELDSKLKARDSEFSQLSEKLSSIEQQQAEKIEQARKDALEQAKSKGDIAAIEQRYQEQMQDLEKRTAERVRQEVQQEYTLKEVQNKAKLELNEIVHALKPKDEFAKRLIEDHLRTRQKVEEGRIIYTNDDGSASTLDYKGLIAELQESPMFKPLSSYTPPASGGGLINGSKGGSAPVAKNDVKANLEKRLKQQGLQ
ncbi:hypothetical protein [Pseudoalteromonas sp.]|uniref:hypothetical protein n=1 Tax=Pseudoalteromonas sp. TaxID=53249 RepID=UPI003D0F87D3